MAKWQRTQKDADKKQAGAAVGTDTKTPRVFTGQTRIPRDKVDELLRRVAGPIGNSLDGEIVDPDSGKFFHDPEISAAGGTDVDRP